MSRAESKEALLSYLFDEKVSVIALKGLWGTGKTTLWQEACKEVRKTRKEFETTLYLSLFGISGLEGLKLGLLKASLPIGGNLVDKADKVAGWALPSIQGLIKAYSPKQGAAGGLLSGLGSLVQSFATDLVLKDRLIILDDVERRNVGLSMDQLFGFVDLLKRSQCRVLLLYNEERIETNASNRNESEWTLFKEKCIDREVTLLTTPEEAADFGLEARTPYIEIVRSALIHLQITNIRVVQRVSRVVVQVLGDSPDISPTVADDLVPAIVLLTGLYFRAIPTAPSIDAVVSEWAKSCAGNPPTTEDGKRVFSMMSRLNLTRDQPFLRLVKEHLTTGRLYRREFANHLAERNERAEHSSAEESAQQHIQRMLLDPKISGDELVVNARANIQRWRKVLPEKISIIARDLEKRGARDLAEELLKEWCAFRRSTPVYYSSFFQSIDALHPAVAEAVKASNIAATKPREVLPSIRQLLKGSWSPEDEEAINGASEPEMRRLLTVLGQEEFSNVLAFYDREMKQPILEPSDATPKFAIGLQTFRDAANAIIQEGVDCRLIELLQLHFGDRLSVPLNQLRP